MIESVSIGAARLVCADALTFIKTLPAASIDLIVTDPPYFAIVENEWDNQWDDEAAYLSWLKQMVVEFCRVLKPTGSLYMFSGNTLAAETEIIVKASLNVLNSIVWAKPSGSWGKHRKERFRRYYPASERVIFAEHWQVKSTAPGNSSYEAQCEMLRRRVFAPVIAYFADARAALKVSAADIHAATGTKMCSHWFSPSQWQMPKPDQYAQLQALFAHKAQGTDCPGLPRDYDDLRHQHDQLQSEYLVQRQQLDAARRYFSVSPAVPHLDVWNYKPVAFYPGKHPCEKPAAMLDDIIRASSRPGDVLADFFMGSGSFIKSAIRHGRPVIGVEMDPERFTQTVGEVDAVHREQHPASRAALSCV